MAFFNLTELGSHEPVKSCIDSKEASPSRTNGGHTGLAASTPAAATSSSDYSQARGSYVKYTSMLKKHQRSPKGPNDIYNKPVTTNMKYGWWMKDGVQTEPWTQTERHANVHSEMTRFVDEMTLTNREFTLF